METAASESHRPPPSPRMRRKRGLCGNSLRSPYADARGTRFEAPYIEAKGEKIQPYDAFGALSRSPSTLNAPGPAKTK
ncbi:hypothetical protein GCM10023232_27900 [Sphingosinicella ginsenosidimutans]